MSDLPNGWLKASLSDFCEIVQGQSPPSSRYNREAQGLPFFQGKADFGSIHPVAKVWCNGPSKIAEQGDVLISIRAPVGPTNFADQRCAIGRGLAAVRPLDEIQTSFVLYAIRFREHELRSVSTGSTFAAISGGQLRGLGIPLPPLPEQRRIVAEIEKQFTRLDEAEQLLSGLKPQLTRLQNSGLRKAFRHLNGYKMKPFGSIVESLRNGISAKPAGDEGSEILKISAVRPFQLRLEEHRFLSANCEHDAFKLRKDDLLFTRYNGNREFVGVCAAVPDLRGNLLYPDKLIRVRLREGHNPRFYELMFNAGPAREYIRSRIRTTAGQSGISGTDLKSAPVPVISSDEQTAVVEEAEAVVSAREYLAGELRGAKPKAARLRQAILAKAFSGQLVPQDPNDEPASVLLERIRSERSIATSQVPRRSVPKKAAVKSE